MKHEIWMEGYRTNGESAPARLLGRVEAETFAEACDELCSPQEWQRLNGTYDRVRGTVWGCRLFNNEADARATFEHDTQVPPRFKTAVETLREAEAQHPLPEDASDEARNMRALAMQTAYARAQAVDGMMQVFWDMGEFAKTGARSIEDVVSKERERIMPIMQSQWQPIETAPKDGTVILGYIKAWEVDFEGGYIVTEVAWEEEDASWHMTLNWGSEHDEANPSYWMPRPPPPSA